MSDETSPPPVFLLASERSGTNLLRRRLNEWQSTVFAPSPPHFLKHLAALVPYYGRLDDDDCFLELIGDALSLCYNHYSPWEIRFTKEEVLEEYTRVHGRKRTVVLLTDLLHRNYAKAKGFASYFCKDNHLFDFAYQIRQDIPDARFLYLHRDPRDYTLSRVRCVPSRSSVTAAARLWRSEQMKCIRIVSDPAFEECCYRMSYEQFISEEATYLKDICSFFGLERQDRPRDASKFDTGTPRAWSNIHKPTMQSNYGKYKTAFSRAQIRTIEAITWTQMNFLGYQPESSQRPKLPSYYAYVEPGVTYVYDRLLRPYQLRRDAPGRLDKVKNARRLQAKF